MFIKSKEKSKVCFYFLIYDKLYVNKKDLDAFLHLHLL